MKSRSERGSMSDSFDDSDDSGPPWSTYSSDSTTDSDCDDLDHAPRRVLRGPYDPWPAVFLGAHRDFESDSE